MPIEPSHNLMGQSISGLRPLGAVEVRAGRAAGAVPPAPTPASSASAGAAAMAPFQPSRALDAGEAPMDAERIAVIRRAVQTGAYPVIPTKIADAMIAAGLLLRTTQ